MNRSILSRTAMALGLAMALPASAYVYVDESGRRYECYDELITREVQSKDHTTAGTLAGGAIGGLAGNQFGEGKGNTAMTAAGAVAGALIGRNATKPKTTQVTRTERRCRPL